MLVLAGTDLILSEDWASLHQRFLWRTLCSPLFHLTLSLGTSVMQQEY